jgi:hypothetical protein
MTRHFSVRDMAATAAVHPRMVQAVTGAVLAVLPGLLEEILRDMSGGETVRLRPAKIPRQQRAQRDEHIDSLLRQGMAPGLIAVQVRCSERHVYNRRAALAGQAANSLAAPADCKTRP